VLGQSAVSRKPFLDLVTIAMHQAGQRARPDVRTKLLSVFGLSDADVDGLLAAASTMTPTRLRSLQERSKPVPARRTRRTLADALAVGKTPVAERLVTYVGRADEIAAEASRHVNAYLEEGDRAALDRFVSCIADSGVASVSEHVLHEAFRRSDFGELLWADATAIQGRVPDERLIKLYACHPVMNRRYFGRLLALKLNQRIMPSGGELLTACFIFLAMLDSPFWGDALRKSLGPQRTGIDIDRDKIRTAEDWAELRCSGWLAADGADELARVTDAWITHRCRHIRGRSDEPQEPVHAVQWQAMVSNCLHWLGDRWRQEIGVERWTSEARLLTLIQAAFKGKEVVRYARPLWLAPQHLDFYVPELSLAIEYMGEQHYSAVEFFGGEAGLAATIERDRRKAEICHACGVRLAYVRHDEDMKAAVNRLKRQLTPKVG